MADGETSSPPPRTPSDDTPTDEELPRANGDQKIIEVGSVLLGKHPKIRILPDLKPPVKHHYLRTSPGVYEPEKAPSCARFRTLHFIQQAQSSYF